VREQIPLVVILGPTAVGKSEVAIQLAERLGGEIVSADTRLFYRGMDIGTAKPSPEERSRVPHHLIDVADPDEIWSLAQYKVEARRVIEGIHARRCLPFLVGGSGQYIWAVVRGWDVPEVPPNLPLRQALELWSHDIGKDGLHYRLTVLDPHAAARIDARNLRRTIRALEVILTTGKRFSEQRTQSPPLYNTSSASAGKRLFARSAAAICHRLPGGHCLYSGEYNSGRCKGADEAPNSHLCTPAGELVQTA